MTAIHERQVPPAMKAAEAIGLTQSEVAKMLGGRRLQDVNAWWRARRKMNRRDYIALITLIRKLADKIEGCPASPDPVRERWRQAALASCWRWLDMADDEIRSCSENDIFIGGQVGLALWEKWQREDAS